MKRLAAGQHLVNRVGPSVQIDANMDRGVGLRIEIDQAHALPLPSQPRCQIDTRRRLADPAFLIHHRNRTHRLDSLWSGGASRPDSFATGSGVYAGEESRERAIRVVESPRVRDALCHVGSLASDRLSVVFLISAGTQNWLNRLRHRVFATCVSYSEAWSAPPHRVRFRPASGRFCRCRPRHVRNSEVVLAD